jgi:hypothetical protein
MKRREFITLVSVVTAWPLTVRAQMPPRAAVGLLGTGSTVSDAHPWPQFDRGLIEAGYVKAEAAKVIGATGRHVRPM